MNIHRRIAQLEQTTARQALTSKNAPAITVQLAADPVAADLMRQLRARCCALDAPDAGRQLANAIFADAEARELARGLSRRLSTRKAGSA